jgi:hypothetical protein
MEATTDTTTATPSSDAATTTSTPAKPAAKKTAAKKTAAKPRAAKTEVSAAGSRTETAPAFEPVTLERKGVERTAYSPSEKVALEFDGYRDK